MTGPSMRISLVVPEHSREREEEKKEEEEEEEEDDDDDDDEEEEEDAFRPLSSAHILELSPMYLFQDRSFSSMVKASSRQRGRKREPHDAAFGPPALDGSSLSPVRVKVLTG